MRRAHIKPSKFDRARVILIGDGLGRVIAETIRHVKRFYGADAVLAIGDVGRRRASGRTPGERRIRHSGFRLRPASGHRSRAPWIFAVQVIRGREIGLPRARLVRSR